MGSNKTDEQLHIFFLPLMAQGHLIPAIDMAKLFSSRGLKSTIVTTSLFAPFLSKSLPTSDTQIDILTIKLPTAEVGLPEDVEGVHMAKTPDMQNKFFRSCGLLGPQIVDILEQRRRRRHRLPDCLVADMFFPWATDVAAKFGIPCILFHGTSYFALCAALCVFLHEPYKNVSSDSEPFMIPNFPDEIELTRSRVADFVKNDDGSVLATWYKESKKMEARNYGVLVNSFYELEPRYADHYTEVLGKKAWHIGPLFLYEKEAEQRACRGMETSINQHECLKWLDSKEGDSVVYVSFGSVANFADDQLMEIAAGLEASGQQFIWVVKKEKREGVVREEWLPEGFEERMEGRGLIIRGWAPQLMILEHEAVGGFVTHCGWNSTLESVCSGVPMVSWPVSAEQFYNEKLVTRVLRIGVEVGAKKWKRLVGDFVKREAVEKAVRNVMEGEEAEEMRSRAKRFAEMARRAVEEGGSSVSDLDALFEDLRSQRAARDSTKKNFLTK
ncbi:hypothetical protein TIFTF001_007013 [Ficus carica]|uniref:Glycosyltransferase n=1 Tax=Ficus carica TaxID=3494 RepID=A0AA87ZQM1_FICCA|nr:hypothetical protein TIFTF001_007013 [Ficus carica]